jgi:hypothetical protein
MSGFLGVFRQKEFGDARLEGTLNWSRTLRNTGRPRKRATLTSNFFSRRGGFGEKPATNHWGLQLRPWRHDKEDVVVRARLRSNPAILLCARRKGPCTVCLCSMVAATWNAPRALWERTACRMSMRGGGIAGAAYLLRLSLSPTDEDWQKGEEHGRWWLGDALRRPLGRIRMHWQGRPTES